MSVGRGRRYKEKEQREITLETSITLHAVVWRIVSSFINYNDYSLTFFVLRTIWETYINFELSHAAKSHAWEGYSIRDMQKKIYALHNGLFGPPLRFSWRWYTLNSDYHLTEFFKSGLLNSVCWIKVSKERHLLWTHWFELLFPNAPRPITAKIETFTCDEMTAKTKLD